MQKKGLTAVATAWVLLFAWTQGAHGGERLRLGMAQGAGGAQTLPVLAEAEGYFKDAGLNVEILRFASTSDGIAALNAGRIDVGISFGVGSPLTFAAQGAPIVIIAGNLAGGHPILTLPENADSLRGVEDFRGKVVGTPRLYTADVVFKGAVRFAGMRPGRDLEVVEFRRPNDVLEAVKSGKVDIGVASTAVTGAALEAGLAIPLWSNDLFAHHPCCRIITTRQTLAARRGELIGLLEALLRAEKKYVEDPEAAVRVNTAYFQLEEDIVRLMTIDPHIHVSVDPNTRGVAMMWDYMIGSEYIESDMNPRDLIDASLYVEALEKLRKGAPDEFWESLAVRFAEWNGE